MTSNPSLVSDRLRQLVDRVILFYDGMSDEEKNGVYAAHHLDHVIRVIWNVKDLADSLGSVMNLEATMAAAACHDLGYGQDKDNHPLVSAEMSVDYLRNASFRSDEVSTIKRIILSHDRDVREPQSIEEKVLYIADKLDLLGYDGIARCFIIAGRDTGDRDEVAERLARYLEEKVRFMLSLEIAQGLIESRWREASSVLHAVLQRKPPRNVALIWNNLA